MKALTVLKIQEVIIASLIGACSSIVMFMVVGFRFEADLVDNGYAEYYIDKDNNKSFRMLEPKENKCSTK